MTIPDLTHIITSGQNQNRHFNTSGGAFRDLVHFATAYVNSGFRNITLLQSGAKEECTPMSGDRKEFAMFVLS
jgi:hypothetical protein